MPVIALRNEAEVIQKLLKAKSAEYGLNSLVSDSNIITVLPEMNHQFPSISIIKMSAAIEGFVGDQMDSEMGEYQPTVITITCKTLKNITKNYNAVTYKNDKLARLIGEIVQQILFDNKEYEDPGNPGFQYVLNTMSSETESESFTVISPIFTVSLTYSVLFREVR